MTQRKRVPVRTAKDRDLLVTAMGGCPPALRPTVAPLVDAVALAAAVRDELPPGAFERLYEPLATDVSLSVWAGDELLSLQDREALAALHASGMSASKIGRELGISRESVLRRISPQCP
jgi:DNA-binding NarL/FixJ family response regulator